MRTCALMHVNDKTSSYVKHCAEQLLRRACGMMKDTSQNFSQADQLLRIDDQPFLSITERCLHLSLLE